MCQLGARVACLSLCLPLPLFLVVFFLLFNLFLLFLTSSPSTPPYIPYSFFSLLVAGGDEAVTPGSNDIKSTRLALLLSLSLLFTSLHSCLLSPLSGWSDPHLGVAGFCLHPVLIGECFGGVAVKGPGGQGVMDGHSSGPLFSIPRPLSSHCLPGARLCW